MERSWVDVAKSISAFKENEKWYGIGSCKWKAMIQLMREMKIDIIREDVQEPIEDMYVRGVIEWVLSHLCYLKWKDFFI